MPIAGNMTGFVRGDYSYVGRKYWQTDNVDVQNPLNLFNVRLGVRTKSWDTYLFVKNLTNVRYYADYNPKAYSGLPYDIGSLAEGRTFGIEGRFRF
jgi:iron complex outermembrane receptor protein